MAILALIVTPLVMNIIRKAKTAADKRSIDAYGRSIEIAIANYLLDKGDFPTSINDLTIEYSGDEVVCSTTQLNSDSSVYLTGCAVAGKNVDYSYGSDKNPVVYDEYSIGDEVEYKGIDYYVIDDSGEDEVSVTLLKKTPLTVEEVNLYGGVGTENNHVNVYVTSNVNSNYYKKAKDVNGYGGLAYFSSEVCSSDTRDFSGCTTDYENSDIKYVVDAWAIENSDVEDLVLDSAGYKVRLVALDEISSLGYEWTKTCDTCGMGWLKTENVPSFFYDSSYMYWTMSKYQDSNDAVWYVSGGGNLHGYSVCGGNGYVNGGEAHVIKPVITVKKSALQ